MLHHPDTIGLAAAATVANVFLWGEGGGGNRPRLSSMFGPPGGERSEVATSVSLAVGGMGGAGCVGG